MNSRAAIIRSVIYSQQLRTFSMTVNLLMTLAITGVHAEELTGRVTAVHDGDTVTMAVGPERHRIRLLGIDAPEHDQPYGTEASRHLSRLLLNNPVRLESDKSDKFGRKVGVVRVQPADCRSCGKTLDAGLAMLTAGLAWWYRFYQSDQSPEDRGQYEFAEFEAKAKKVGLWQAPDPVPPWNWPRGDKARNPAPASGCRIKGNISNNGRIYHLPGQRYYESTRINAARGERWFCSEAEARAAGWRRARD